MKKLFKSSIKAGLFLVANCFAVSANAQLINQDTSRIQSKFIVPTNQTTASPQGIIGDIIGSIGGIFGSCPDLLDGNGASFICEGSEAEYGFNYETFETCYWAPQFGLITHVNGREIASWATNVLADLSDEAIADITSPGNYATAIAYDGAGGKRDQIRLWMKSGGYYLEEIQNPTDIWFRQNVAKPKNITLTPTYRNIPINLHAEATGLKNRICGFKKGDKTIIVLPKPNGNDANITVSSGSANCFSGMQVNLPNNNFGFPASWSIQDQAPNGSTWNSGAYIQNFTSPGNKTISVTLNSPFGCGSVTTSKVVNVPNPPNVYYSIDGIASVTAFDPLGRLDGYINCNNQEYGITLRANETDGTVGNNAVFNWQLPMGWEAQGLTNKNCLQGPCYSTTSRSIYVKATTNLKELKGGKFSLNINSCNSTSNGVVYTSSTKLKELTLSTKAPFTISLPDFTACNNQRIQLTPTPSYSAAYPIQISWFSKTGYFDNYSSTVTGVANGSGSVNYSTNNTLGLQLNKAIGTDSKGCVSTQLTTPDPEGFQFTPRIGSSSSSSGWISGALPRVPQPVTVLGNSIGYDGDIFFIGSDGKAYSYSFNNNNPVWTLNTIPQITNANSKFNSVTRSRTVFFYINSSGGISYQTPYLNGGLPVDVGNSLGATELITDNFTTDVYFRGAGNQIYKYVPFTTNPAIVVVPVATKYGFAAQEGTVVYVNNTTSNLEYKNPNANPVTLSSGINCFTEVKFDYDNNLYFMYCGGTFYKTLKTGNTFGSLVQLSSGRETSTGKFAINNGTGTIYYAGINNSIIQIYKTDAVNYATTYATDNINGDKAGWSLTYGSPHLYYVSTTGLIYNLYYTDCYPKQLRHETVSDVDANLNTTGAVYPNPFSDKLTVSLKGQGEANFEITDALGRQMLNVPYTFAEQVINTSGLQNGLYLCRIVQNGNVLYQSKLKK